MLKYLLLFSVCAFAQKPAFTFAPGSDSLSYVYVTEANALYGLDAIEDDNGDYSFRFSYFNTAISVYQLDTLCFGNVSFQAFEIHEFEAIPTGNVFKMTFALKPQVAKEIFNLIADTKIDAIPTSNLIPSWKQGFDGIGYTFQHKKDSLYILKNYWTPTAQENLPEALLIEDFKNRLVEIAAVDKHYEIFDRMNPFYNYTTGGHWQVLRLPKTKKDYLDYKHRKRLYKKSKH